MAAERAEDRPAYQALRDALAIVHAALVAHRERRPPVRRAFASQAAFAIEMARYAADTAVLEGARDTLNTLRKIRKERP